MLAWCCSNLAIGELYLFESNTLESTELKTVVRVGILTGTSDLRVSAAGFPTNFFGDPFTHVSITVWLPRSCLPQPAEWDNLAQPQWVPETKCLEVGTR